MSAAEIHGINQYLDVRLPGEYGNPGHGGGGDEVWVIFISYPVAGSHRVRLLKKQELFKKFPFPSRSLGTRWRKVLGLNRDQADSALTEPPVKLPIFLQDIFRCFLEVLLEKSQHIR